MRNENSSSASPSGKIAAVLFICTDKTEFIWAITPHQVLRMYVVSGIVGRLRTPFITESASETPTRGILRKRAYVVYRFFWRLRTLNRLNG